MSERQNKQDISQPLVSPQTTGDLRSTTDSGTGSNVVSPLSADQQLQREIDLSYPEVYLGSPEDRSPEVVTFRDGADAPEVVPANNPGHYADEKYMPPRWYRQRSDNKAEQKEEPRDGGGGVPVTVVPEQHKSRFDAESETREADTGAHNTTKTSKRKLYIWLGIAAAAFCLTALAIGLGVGLGTKSSSDNNDSSPTATTASSSTSSTTTSSTFTPTSTTTTTLRCPASNNTIYTTSTKSFTIECGLDHSGSNMATLDAENLTTCLDSCAEEEQCVGATFLGAACYLKGEWSDPVFGNLEVAGGRVVE